MKHYYFKSLTNWTSENKEEKKVLLWFMYGGKKRGKLDFNFFDNEQQAIKFCNNVKMIMN